MLAHWRAGHRIEDNGRIHRFGVAVATVEIVAEDAAAGAFAARRHVLRLQLAAQPPAPLDVRLVILQNVDAVRHLAAFDCDRRVGCLEGYERQRLPRRQLFAEPAQEVVAADGRGHAGIRFAFADASDALVVHFEMQFLHLEETFLEAESDGDGIEEGGRRLVPELEEGAELIAQRRPGPQDGVALLALQFQVGGGVEGGDDEGNAAPKDGTGGRDVTLDVPLHLGGWLAAVADADGPAHQDEAFDPGPALGMFGQQCGDVGERTDGDESERARLRLELVVEEFDGAFLDGALAIGGAQAVLELSAILGRILRRPTRGYRNVVAADGVQQTAQEQGAGVGVAEDSGDAASSNSELDRIRPRARASSMSSPTSVSRRMGIFAGGMGADRSLVWGNRRKSANRAAKERAIVIAVWPSFLLWCHAHSLTRGRTGSFFAEGDRFERRRSATQGSTTTRAQRGSHGASAAPIRTRPLPKETRAAMESLKVPLTVLPNDGGGCFRRDVVLDLAEGDIHGRQSREIGELLVFPFQLLDGNVAVRATPAAIPAGPPP